MKCKNKWYLPISATRDPGDKFLMHIDTKCNYKTSVDCPQVDLVEVEEKQYREATKIVQY
jgi:hypothetical protein